MAMLQEERHIERFLTAWYGLSVMAVDIGLCTVHELDQNEVIPRERMPEVYDSVVSLATLLKYCWTVADII